MNRCVIKAWVILVLAGACTEENIEPGLQLHLNPAETEEIVYSDFISNFDYIKLSTDQNAFIGDIEKIEIHNDRLYVLDARNSVGLFVYDLQGELLYKIQNYGRGPGEFMGPYDFAIDEQEKEIIIYDARDLKLCYFDLENGSFIREVNMEFRFARFTMFDNGLIFLHQQF